MDLSEAKIKQYKSVTRAPHKQIAVEPFPNSARATEARDGLVFNARHRIVPLSVMLESEAYSVGSLIWLRASDAEAPWAKEVFAIDGTSFIIIPENRIIAYRELVEING